MGMEGLIFTGWVRQSGSGQGESRRRKQIDVLLNAMNEKELIVMRATAEGLKKARETEVSE